MKTIQSFLLSFCFVAFSFVANAQNESVKIKVSGECGMCKTKIEKAAKSAGASYAVWDVESKMLTVKYAAGASNVAKIEKAVAATGYDTQNMKASDEAYQKLHECCKYDRGAAAAGEAGACCKDGKCTMEKCSHEGKCKPDMSCCKENGCAEKACCKKENQ